MYLLPNPVALMRTFPRQNPQRFFAPKKSNKSQKSTDERFALSKVEDKSASSVGSFASRRVSECLLMMLCAGVDARGRRETSSKKKAKNSAKGEAAEQKADEFGGYKDRLEYLNALARGEVALDSDSEEESDSSDAQVAKAAQRTGDESDSDSDDSTDGAAVAGSESAVAQANLAPAHEAPVGDATKRMAMVSADWDKLRAVDILAALRPFAPPGGAVLSVAVVPSDFGLQAMARDEQKGPQLPAATEAKGGRVGGSKHEEGHFDNEALRQYERSRLNYYYAVVTCDSARTAASIYAECDGMEYEGSSNFMDLRFIPDEVQIPHAPRDTADDIPSDYEPRRFITHALQATEVPLTWDGDDFERDQAMQALKTALRPKTRREKKKLKKRGRGGYNSEEELEAAEAHMTKFLAPVDGSDDEGGAGGVESDSDSDDSEDQAAVRAKYAALLSGIGGSSGAAGGHDEAADDSDSDAIPMAGPGEEGFSDSDDDEGDHAGHGAAAEGVFRSQAATEGNRVMRVKGGESIEERRAAKAATAKETVFEAYQRKRKEKRAAVKAEQARRKEEVAVGVREGGELGGPQADEGEFKDPLFALAGGADGAAVSGGSGKKAASAAQLALMMGADAQAAESDDDADAYRGGKGKGVKGGKKGRKRRRDEAALVDTDMQSAVAAGIVAGGGGGALSGASKKARAAAAAAPSLAALSDSRFTGVFEDSRFALDPTHPEYKKGSRNDELRKEKIRRTAARRAEQGGGAGAAAAASGGAGGVSGAPAASGGAPDAVSDLASRVASKFAAASSRAAKTSSALGAAAASLAARGQAAQQGGGASKGGKGASRKSKKARK